MIWFPSSSSAIFPSAVRTSFVESSSSPSPPNTFASDEQKKQMAKVYAPAFNNIALDGEGFVMAVTYDLSALNSPFRFPILPKAFSSSPSKL